ncbi:hypothetical protein CCHL11_02970 [Colletotrichum chlorophyti]|uniref:Zn(2)-C6 fungal-type domain-containing protein n=1 Tax=Colletotrichum chlorophyti TaxID=708187 RepID=A0A1Q8S185_9PEZI|nr:hypothetical protein CCHL11_02970 [Colletotrichum chlorophyti]
MSYQYQPHLAPTGSEMNMSHPGYAPNYSAPAPMISMMDPRTHDQTVRERKESFGQASLRLKRAVSTPNVRSLQANMSDPNQLGLAGEKKRNKLGYHRTSVACGHCRRRKIRCIPSPVDVQGRCVNCIRLKKECSFYPVDQPPPPQTTDPRSKALPRASVGSNVTSASSSPAMPAGHPLDVSHHQHYHPGVVPSAQNMAPHGMRPSSIENLGPEVTVIADSASASRQFDFPNQAVADWMHPEDNAGAATKPANPNENWASYSQESPISPSFSPYTAQTPSSAVWSQSDPNAQDDIGWSSFALGGSMTYPRGTQLPSQYPMVPQQGRPNGRKASTMSADVYPSHISTNMPGMDPQGASLSAGAVPPSSYGSWQQPYTYSKTPEGYESWSYDRTGGN